MGQEPLNGRRLVVTPLAPQHDRAAFSCGVPELDDYLRRFALQQDRRDIARPFVASPVEDNQRIVGYYTLSNYTLTFDALPEDLAKGLPRKLPLPATLLGRLAVSVDAQGQRLGQRLLLHALRRALRTTRETASLGVVVDAMTDDLVAFYEKVGFVALHDAPRRLIVPISAMRLMFPEEARALPDAAAMIEDARTRDGQ